MSVAALYDIHGNLPALEAVLEDIDRAGIERLLIGGDIAYGPFVVQTLDRLMALGSRAVWIRGNADRELVEFSDLGVMEVVEGEVRRALEWEAAQLSDDHRDWLAALPPRRRLEIAGLGPVLLCHGSPRRDDEIITSLTSGARLRRVLAGVSEPTVVCGHTHVQFDRQVGSVRVLNAGSVGLPYQAPGAYWLLLGSGVELRRTDYDLGRAVAQIRASGHPLAETFAATLERPPTAEDASAGFEARALDLEA